MSREQILKNRFCCKTPRSKNRGNPWKTVSAVVGAGNDLKIPFEAEKSRFLTFSFRIKVISQAL